jgi:hypothetical protein
VNPDNIETLLPCPRCAHCLRCHGNGTVHCHYCNDAACTKRCVVCETCPVCDGTQLVSAKTSAKWRAEQEGT